jgi:hypothetical protein
MAGPSDTLGNPWIPHEIRPWYSVHSLESTLSSMMSQFPPAGRIPNGGGCDDAMDPGGPPGGAPGPLGGRNAGLM